MEKREVMVKSIGLGLLFGMLSMPAVGASWGGVVDWAQRTEMGTPLSGVIAKVAVKQGESVKKGQLLLQLEQGALQARLAQRQAEMKHKELLKAEASKELERAEELYARTLLADHDLDVAKIAYAEAEAAYQASRAEYRQAREDFDNSALHAPFDAVVLTRHVQPAQTVISRCETQPLVTLASATHLRVRIFIEPDKRESLRSAGNVTVEVAGKSYPGKVDSIGYEAEVVQEALRYPVDVILSSSDLILVGQRARVSQP